MRGLARHAGGAGACGCRAAGEPWPSDPHHRRHDGAEGGASGPKEKRAVAHSQRIRSSARALRSLRADRPAGGRDARPDTGPQRRGPPCRSRLSATRPHGGCARRRRRLRDILVTSLTPEEFSTADVLALYRLRWRIELAFKRLKSLLGLKGPPGFD